MEEKYKRLGKNTILIFIGRAGSSFITFIMLPFYTHWLSPEEYGMVDLINTYAQVLLGFMTCCIADAIFIFPKNTSEVGRKKYFTSGLCFVAIMTILMAVIFAVWRLISSYFDCEDNFTNNTWYIWGFMITAFLQSYTQQFTLSIDKTVVYSISGIVFTFAIAIFSVLLIPYLGMIGYIYSMMLANLFAAFFSFILSKSYRYLDLRKIDLSYLKVLLSYSVPLIPNSIMWWLVNGMNRPVMDTYLGLSAIGIFAVANRFPGVLSILNNVFANAWSISVIEEFGKKDFNHFFNTTLKVIFFAYLLVGCVLVIFSKLIIKIFADIQYLEAWKLMPVLIFGVICQNVSGLIGSVFAAEKKSKYFFYSSVWGGVSSIILTFLFIKTMGVYGAAIAVASSFIVMCIVRLKYAWKHIYEFSVLYYAFNSILFIGLCVITIIRISFFLKIICSVVIIGMIIISNRDLLKMINVKLKLLLNKKGM